MRTPLLILVAVCFFGVSSIQLRQAAAFDCASCPTVECQTNQVGQACSTPRYSRAVFRQTGFRSARTRGVFRRRFGNTCQPVMPQTAATVATQAKPDCGCDQKLANRLVMPTDEQSKTMTRFPKQLCPYEFIGKLFDNYYYYAADCPSGTKVETVLIYSHRVEMGCNAATGSCNATVSPDFVLDRTDQFNFDRLDPEMLEKLRIATQALVPGTSPTPEPITR